MYQNKIPKDLTCGITVTMEIIGGKWKPCIINKIFKGLKRPSEIHKAYPGASPRVINQQLSELEQHGIVTKKIFPVLPLKVEYELTVRGLTLIPLVTAMLDWGNINGSLVHGDK